MIKKGQTLKARFICDYNTIATCVVIDRTKTMATIAIDGEVKKCKVYSNNGREYVYALGKYSMAPMFHN